MIVKIIIAALVIYALYSLFFKKNIKIDKKSQFKDEKDEESFMACKNCGVFVSTTSLKNGLCPSCQKDRK